MALLSTHEIALGIEGTRWEQSDGELITVRKLSDFPAALAFVNRVGRRAEEADHHPDIDIRFTTVTLRLSTHSEGGVTAKDVEMARALDAID